MDTINVDGIIDIGVPTESGHWVNEKYAQLAEIVRDYNSNLSFCWIPPEHRSEDDKRPYAIVDDRIHRVILYADETATPEAILSTLFQADAEKQGGHNAILAKMDADNAAAEAFRLKKQMEDMEEARDRALFMMGSPLNFLKMKDNQGDLIKYDDQRRRLGRV